MRRTPLLAAQPPGLSQFQQVARDRVAWAYEHSNPCFPHIPERFQRSPRAVTRGESTNVPFLSTRVESCFCMNTTEKSRLSLELSPTVSQLLEHVSEITGTPKTQLVQAALVEALPDFLERADRFKKRSQELSQQKPKR